jgi:hypothetical protein
VGCRAEVTMTDQVTTLVTITAAAADNTDRSMIDAYG